MIRIYRVHACFCAYCLFSILCPRYKTHSHAVEYIWLHFKPQSWILILAELISATAPWFLGMIYSSFRLFHISVRNISAEGHFGQNFSVTEHFGHGSFRSGNISVTELFGQRTFRSRNISVTEHFGHGTFRSQNILVTEHFGQGTFQSENISVRVHFGHRFFRSENQL